MIKIKKKHLKRNENKIRKRVESKAKSNFQQTNSLIFIKV